MLEAGILAVTEGARMLYIVTVTISEPDFVDRMSEMRTWFDHHHVEPSRFRFATGDTCGECRVHFTCDADAAAFARQFGGEVSTVAGITAAGSQLSSHSASSSGSGRARPS